MEKKKRKNSGRMQEEQFPTKEWSGEQMREWLAKKKEVDVRTVNPEELVDIEEVHINMALPEKERMLDYIRQVKNPYCYKAHGMIVKISFAGKEKLEDCLMRYLSMKGR